MQTGIIIECMRKALENEAVSKRIQAREKDPDVRIGGVKAVVIARENSDKKYEMQVKVGFDFELKVNDPKIREDIVVDVFYRKNKKTKKEAFKVGDPEFKDEI